ncbi:MAG: hypothetical protein IPN90_13355 [Elusimicrobia bacterium]|nr:hypothetical protein [Elusimicrobiota bacterium]
MWRNRYDVEGQLTNVRGWTDTLTTQGTYKSVEDWGGALLGGEEVVVVFDETMGLFDDEVYGGEGDPLGRLKGGETYRVVYGGGETRTEGYDQATGAVSVSKDENLGIGNGILVVWGETLSFNGKGELRDGNGDLVGHLTTEGASSRTGWVIEGDADRDGVEDVGETWTVEAQRTRTHTASVYAVVRGQGVVLGSKTESYACDGGGVAITDSLAHGYNRSETIVRNQYDVEGQLVGATGETKGRSNVEVKTPKRVGGVIVGDANGNGFEEDNEKGNWEYTWKDQGRRRRRRTCLW